MTKRAAKSNDESCPHTATYTAQRDEYIKQREQAIATVNQLTGAIAALDRILTPKDEPSEAQKDE